MRCSLLSSCTFTTVPFKNTLISFLFSRRSADGDDEEEVVHMGNAIMSFYSALIDLLGRCAPEMHVCTLSCFLLNPFAVLSW